VSDHFFDSLRHLIQQDPGHRGLATMPGDNLLTACPGDLEGACRAIASTAHPRLAVVTGFFIPQAQPPTGETDGPPGALFLARALTPVGIEVALATDPFCIPALQSGLKECGLEQSVRIVELPSPSDASSAQEYRAVCYRNMGNPTHLIALERVGPTHTVATLTLTDDYPEEYRRIVSPEHRGLCHTMRGRDITTLMRPAHLLFEAPFGQRPVTIGIGDGGNEIGMGKIPWHVIDRNISGGGIVACRTPCDLLIVCGVSNWGAYALAAGVRHLLGASPAKAVFDAERERELLQRMVDAGPLVDGILGKPVVSVDGLPFERHAEVLQRMAALASGAA
jgi:hypothetical protein